MALISASLKNSVINQHDTITDYFSKILKTRRQSKNKFLLDLFVKIYFYNRIIWRSCDKTKKTLSVISNYLYHNDKYSDLKKFSNDVFNMFCIKDSTKSHLLMKVCKLYDHEKNEDDKNTIEKYLKFMYNDDSNNIELLSILGNYYYDLGNISYAKKYFLEEKNIKKSFENYYNLAFCYLKEGKISERLIQYLKNSISIAKEDEEDYRFQYACYHVGKYYYKNGNIEHAKSFLKKGKNDSDCLELLIKIYEEEKNYEYIEECYLKLYSVNKKNKIQILNKLIKYYLKNKSITKSSIKKLLTKIENNDLRMIPKKYHIFIIENIVKQRLEIDYLGMKFKKKNNECNICSHNKLYNFVSGCCHTVCVDCMVKLMKKSNSCPFCREKLIFDLTSECDFDDEEEEE
jgi:tetratricopeptide (TPR) repeat protein